MLNKNATKIELNKMFQVADKDGNNISSYFLATSPECRPHWSLFMRVLLKCRMTQKLTRHDLYRKMSKKAMEILQKFFCSDKTILNHECILQLSQHSNVLPNQGFSKKGILDILKRSFKTEDRFTNTSLETAQNDERQQGMYRFNEYLPSRTPSWRIMWSRDRLEEVLHDRTKHWPRWPKEKFTS